MDGVSDVQQASPLRKQSHVSKLMLTAIVPEGVYELLP